MGFNGGLLFSVFLLSIEFVESSREPSEGQESKESSNPLLRLSRDLLSNYEPDLLPNCSENRPPVNVFIGLALKSILDVNEREQKLMTSVWVRWMWKDCQLRWDPSDYDGISDIHLSRNHIWVPDITLYDSASVMDQLDVIQYQRPWVTNDGIVRFSFPSIITSSCFMNIHFFPYDSQRCRLKFGSWTYSSDFVNVMNFSNRGDTDNFISNNEWELMEFSAWKNEKNYSAQTIAYPDVTFYIGIKRNPLHYHINLLIPCVMINLIGVFMFILPPESGERMSLAITALLSMVVFSMNVSSALPTTGISVPYISKYFSLAIGLVASSTLLTVVIIRFHHKPCTTISVPSWLRKALIEWIGSLLLVRIACTTVEDDQVDLLEGDPVKTRARNANDWRELLVVVDRIFFVLSSIVFIVITTGIFVIQDVTPCVFDCDSH